MRSSAIGALAVFVCAVTAQVATARPLPPADVAVINQAVAQEMASNKLIGVTVSVQSPRGTFIRSYGKADIRTGRALQPGDHFRIASVTKTFTATAVLRLVDQRKLRLSDKLARYVPGVPNGKRITIGQVLAMRSGVFNFIDDKRFTTRYNANPLLPGWRPRDILPILRRHRPSFSPGKRTEYSDSNYELLGLVLEKVTGQPAERVLTNTVIKPLGLKHTSFPTTPAMPRPFAHGYDTSFGPLKDLTFSTPAVPWTAGAMLSTVPDMTLYARKLATGALLSKRLQAQRLGLGKLPNPGGARAGYGLGITGIGDWLGHDGAIFGYSNAVFFDPKEKATVVVMVNKASTTLVAALPVFFAVATPLYPRSFPH